MRLQGKRAVITGSARGIGRAIAVRFAREGADVVINDIDISGTARETLAAVETAGRRGVLIQADISRTDDARRLIDDAVRQASSRSTSWSTTPASRGMRHSST